MSYLGRVAWWAVVTGMAPDGRDRAEQGSGADALQRPLRSRFRARLTAGVRCPRKRICYTPCGFLFQEVHHYAHV